MLKIENFFHEKLQRNIVMKKVAKRIYQSFCYVLSDKVRAWGNIERISPNDNFEYFFGYYDKIPWDITDRYILCLKVKNTYKHPASCEPAEIILIDTVNNSFETIADTRAWNVQMGCRLQWLGPDFESKIIYNDFREGKLCSVIIDLHTKKENEICLPIYDVARNGEIAFSLDFIRLNKLRTGYGYININNDKNYVTETCIYHIDLLKNTKKPILSYDYLKEFVPRKNMINATHKVNHIMINPDGGRIMFLHRWITKQGKKSRLITMDTEGNKLYNLLDDGMVSHCCWKNDNEILTYAYKEGIGKGYYLLQDESKKIERILISLISDGHPSFSTNGKKIVTDTYPDKERKSSIYVHENINGITEKIASVYSPFKYDNDVRCDLHPRWNNGSNMVCFDGVFEGKRALYKINIESKK